GPSSILMAENSAIEWTSLSGAGANEQTLAHFFAPLSAKGAIFNPGVDNIFDPRALYDSANGRFVVVADEVNQAYTSSHLLIAVSIDSNPNDGWHYQYIDTTKYGGQGTWA